MPLVLDVYVKCVEKITFYGRFNLSSLHVLTVTDGLQPCKSQQNEFSVVFIINIAKLHPSDEDVCDALPRKTTIDHAFGAFWCSVRQSSLED